MRIQGRETSAENRRQICANAAIGADVQMDVKQTRSRGAAGCGQEAIRSNPHGAPQFSVSDTAWNFRCHRSHDDSHRGPHMRNST